jgi:elongation factor Tu
MNHVDNYIKQPVRHLDLPLIISVEGSLVVRGRGTVVTGKVEQGVIKVNDELDLVGEVIQKTLCLGLEMFRKSLDFAEVGDNVGVLIRGVKKKEVSRGDILTHSGFIKPSSNFTCKVYILSKKEGGRSTGFAGNYKPQFFFRTCNITGNLIFPESISFILPGDSAELVVNLYRKAPLTLGLKVIMREGNLTIGAGIITKID